MYSKRKKVYWSPKEEHLYTQEPYHRKQSFKRRHITGSCNLGCHCALGVHIHTSVFKLPHHLLVEAFKNLFSLNFFGEWHLLSIPTQDMTLALYLLMCASFFTDSSTWRASSYSLPFGKNCRLQPLEVATLEGKVTSIIKMHWSLWRGHWNCRSRSRASFISYLWTRGFGFDLYPFKFITWS